MAGRSKVSWGEANDVARSNGSQCVNPTLWRGLQGLWHMNLGSMGEQVFDLSAYAHDGAITGATWIPNGLRFDYSGDYVKLGNIPQMNVGTGDFTVMATAFWAATHFNNNSIAALGTYNDGFLMYESSGPVRFYCENVYADCRFMGEALLAGMTHCTILRRADQMEAYVNAEPATFGTDNISGTSANITTTLSSWIGARDNGSGSAERLLDGDVESVGMWNRALLPSEIKAFYEDPYALIRQPSKTFFFDVNGAGVPPVAATVGILGRGRMPGILGRFN